MAATIHYASYLVNGTEVFGTAELLNGSGYLFRTDGERTATLVSYKDINLMLYGRVELAFDQYLDDELHGGLVAVACSRDEGRA